MTNWTIKAADFAVLRTPLLPESFLNLSHNIQSEYDEDKVKEGLDELIKWAGEKRVALAIEFASPSLAEKINQLMNDLSTENLKLASSIYKYITRMCTRSTPFGAFSGVMTVKVDECTTIDAPLDMELFLRLDNRCLAEIIKKAESQAVSSRNTELKLRKNNSLYQMAEDFRFVSHSVKNNIGDYKLDEVKVSEAITQALRISSDWLSVDQIAQKLKCHYPKAETEDLIGFVYDLFENQLLESNLNVVVSSDNSLKEFIRRSEQSGIPHQLIDQCKTICQILTNIQSIKESDLKKNLHKVKSLLAEMLPEYELKHWLHVDAFRSNTEAAIGKDKLQPILASLKTLAPMMWRPSEPLKEFVQQFQALYGDDAQVPLLEALDVDNGVPFGQKRGGRSPLLDGMLTGRQATTRQLNWHNFDQFVLNKVMEATSQGQSVLNLDIDEVSKYAKATPQPHAAFNSSVAVHGSFLKDQSEEDLFQLKGVVGPSSLLFLGRFCCGDKKLAKECVKLAEQEQQNDADVIYAEVVHVSQAVTANISCRPPLRGYEIIYGPCDSSMCSERQITCDDLYIQVNNGQIGLFSRRLNKQVKPRLASAHNTSGMNLPVYQFLSAMQGAEGWFTNININSVANSLPYLPEIRIGNLLISERRWLITHSELEQLKACDTEEAKFKWVTALFKEKNMSTSIAIREGDNILEFDVRNALSLLMFANELIRRSGSVELIESMKNKTSDEIRFSGKTFRHETIIPVMVDAGIKRTKAHGNSLDIQSIKNMASLPGESWKYLKVYTGEATADKLLAEQLSPLAHKLTTNQDIAHWHFIRYLDPDFHIRIRFKLKNDSQIGAINQQINQHLRPLYQQGLIQRVEESTYLPETERYGGESVISTCEHLFHLNSVMSSAVIAHSFNHPDKDQLRWQWTLRLVWQLVMSVTDSLEEMEQFYKKVSHSYDREFGLNTITKNQLSDNYRSAMPAVAESLSLDFDRALSMSTMKDVLPAYQKTLSQLIALCDRERKDLMKIIQSLVHMDCNRMFVINPRANEWILYHYMARYSRTVIARKFKPGEDLIARLLSPGISQTAQAAIA